MDQCKACEGTGAVHAVSPHTGDRDLRMPKETCPDCGGTGGEPETEEAPAVEEPVVTANREAEKAFEPDDE